MKKSSLFLATFMTASVWAQSGYVVPSPNYPASRSGSGYVVAAPTVRPDQTRDLCFRASYDDAHLDREKTQFVQSLELVIAVDEEGGYYWELAAKTVAYENGQRVVNAGSYTNEGSCRFTSASVGSCKSGEGTVFTLTGRAAEGNKPLRVTFEIPRGNAVALKAPTANGLALRLDGRDAVNRSFHLKPTLCSNLQYLSGSDGGNG